jgi:hypothetical protein
MLTLHGSSFAETVFGGVAGVTAGTTGSTIMIIAVMGIVALTSGGHSNISTFGLFVNAHHVHMSNTNIVCRF